MSRTPRWARLRTRSNRSVFFHIFRSVLVFLPRRCCSQSTSLSAPCRGSARYGQKSDKTAGGSPTRSFTAAVLRPPNLHLPCPLPNGLRENMTQALGRPRILSDGRRRAACRLFGRRQAPLLPMGYAGGASESDITTDRYRCRYFFRLQGRVFHRPRKARQRKSGMTQVLPSGLNAFTDEYWDDGHAEGLRQRGQPV